MSRCFILQTSVSTTNRSARLARTWFTDEKIFTVQTPTNSQNDRVHANVALKRDIPSERLLKGRKLFSQSIMHSVAVSQLGKSSLVFVERGAKVNRSYITVTPSYIKDYCQTLELTLVTISLSAGWTTCSSFTKNNCFSHCSSDYHWLSQQTEDSLYRTSL